MIILVRFCLILLFAFGFLVDASLIMNGATDCSFSCTVYDNAICASQAQIHYSNLMLILAVGTFVGAFRYLYIEICSPLKPQTLELSNN